MPEQNKTNQEISAEQSVKSLEKEKEELLKDIYVIASDNKGHYQDRTSNVISKFSSLLIILFREADKSTKKMVRLTYALFGLTVVLLGVTIWQCILASKSVKDPVVIYLKENQPDKKANKKDASSAIYTNRTSLPKVHIVPSAKDEVHK